MAKQKGVTNTRRRSRGQQHHKTTLYQHDEFFIQRTIKDMKEWQLKHPEEKISVREWSIQKGIDYQRLNRRWKGNIGSLHNRPASHLRLTPLQSQSLCQYIKVRDRMCLPVPLKMIQDTANEIIYCGLDDEQRFNFKPVSESWTSRWLAKHRVGVIKAKPIELARKEAHQPDEIRQWFASYTALCEQYNI